MKAYLVFIATGWKDRDSFLVWAAHVVLLITSGAALALALISAVQK